MGFFVEDEFYDNAENHAFASHSGQKSSHVVMTNPVITAELLDTYMRYRFDEGMTPQEAVQQMDMDVMDGDFESFAQRLEHQALRAGRHAP